MDNGPSIGVEDASWIIESKFEPRRPNINLVFRKRLTTILDRALKCKIALVVAPAGFGKSTLLCQWCEIIADRDIRFAWLTLDKNDDDARQFLAYISMALFRAGIDIEELGVGAQNGFSDSPVRLVLSSLIRLLRRTSVDCVLVLDDYHSVSSMHIDGIVKQLLLETPDNFTIIINSRTTPSLDTPLMVASGHAIHIGPEDLRLTYEETQTLLADVASEVDIQTIYGQTEGWPVAVQLAKVQKQARPNEPVEPATPSGLIASYLTDQILSTLDNDVRDFLLTTSVLESFCPELADIVREQSNSLEILNRLESLTALLIPLNIDGDWYRLHHLFAEYLREILRKESPKRINDIYLKASEWHSKQGYLIEAVKYAALAADFAKCEVLILKAGCWKIILNEGIGVLRSLFRLLPDHIISSSPRLLVARAYLHCKDGEQHEARGLLEISLTLDIDGVEDEMYERDFMVVESMVNAYEDRKTWVDDLGKIQARERLLSQIDPLEAGTLKCEEVLIHFALGDFDAASHSIKSAFGYMRKSGSVLGLNYCYLHAGVAAIYSAKFDVAKANISRALEMAENNFGSDSGLKHMALVLDYALKVWSGEATPDTIKGFSQTLAYIEEYDGWVEIYLVGLDAAFHLAEQCADYEFALEISTRFMNVAKKRYLERLDIFAQILKVKALHYLGRRDEMSDMVTQVQDWTNRNTEEMEPRAWQCFFLAATSLLTIKDICDKSILTTISNALDHAQHMNAHLFVMRLTIAKFLVLPKLERDVEDHSDLLAVVRKASRERMMGPFLVNAETRRLLKQVRTDLQTNEDELIVVNFVSDILTQFDVLRPQKKKNILSAREQDILEKLAIGQSNKEIARTFELTENTVKFHLKNIFSKLSVNKRTQAIAEAHRLNLLD